MSQNNPGRRDALTIRFLVLGFVCTLVLAVLTLGFSAIGTTRVEQLTLELADDSQRSTYYLGDVGEQLARLRSHVALGLRESPNEFSQRAALISQIDLVLRNDLDALSDTLDDAARQRWSVLHSEVLRLRTAYADAADAIREGQPGRGSELLAREASSGTNVHDSLDYLQQTHREAVLGRLRSAHRKEARMRLLQLFLTGVFLAGMVLIWSVMISVLRRQQRLVSDYTRRLEAANADLDAFAGRVAHDLRNALGPIVMVPSLLRRVASMPRVLEIAERTERCCKRALGLVDSLLAFSRASRSVDVHESGALLPAIQGTVEELGPKIEELRVRVEVNEIPDVHLRCSEDLLHIVFANLFGNAVKFLAGRDTRVVRISARVEDSFCRIDIEDTGPGIPLQAQARIFEPFFRVEGVRAPGTGIGLATVRRVIEARGGHIAVQSSEGDGSRFLVSLPLAQPRGAQPSASETAVTPSLHAPGNDGPRLP